MFEEFGDKYNAYNMQVVIVSGNEYLMKHDGTVYTRVPGLPQVTDKDIVVAVQAQAKKDGGWDVRSE